MCRPGIKADRVASPTGPSVLAIGTPGRAATELAAGPPVDADVPDVALTAASSPRIDVRAASVRGLQHRAAGEPRQDAFALRLAHPDSGGDELIAVVCDGVGSLPRSHEAAALVAVRLAEQACAGANWPAAFRAVNDELKPLAWSDDATDGRRPVMATTALALRVKCEGEGWRGRAAWVGDSPLWHLAGDGDWSLCTPWNLAGDEPRFIARRPRACRPPPGNRPSSRSNSTTAPFFSCPTASATRWPGWTRFAPPCPAGGRRRPTSTTSADRSASPGRRTWTTARWWGCGCGPDRRRSPGRARAARAHRLWRLRRRVPGKRALALRPAPPPWPTRSSPSEPDRQARAARMAVDLRDGLDRNDRDLLDRLSAWPRALVEDDSGRVCGLLMPLLPDDFFTHLIDPQSGRTRRRQATRPGLADRGPRPSAKPPAWTCRTWS